MRKTDEEKYTGIFNDSFPPIVDGVTLAVENYCHYLSEKGKRPMVVTPWNPTMISTPYPIKRFFSLPIWNRHPYRYGYPKLDPFIWLRLRTTDFRILHSHCPFSSGRLAVYVKRKHGTPLVGTFHSKYRSDLEHSFENVPWMVPIIMRRILNFFNACDEVWIPQAAVEETIREYGYKGPLTVVENGNDFASAVAEEDLSAFRQESRKQCGIPDEAISLLFVGQHIREKGILVIADALGLLKRRGVKFRMTFIGTGYAVDELRERLASHGLDKEVQLLGIVTDRAQLRRRYAAADLFLFPSFYDNAPLVVREAAAMGTPTLMLAGSTASEVITDGGNGFLTSQTPEAYADAVERFWHERQLLHDAGRGARHSLVRSWEDVVKEVSHRYDEIIEKHSRR